MMKTYVVGEIGQNHNGSVDTAKKLCDVAKKAGFDAVKMTKRDLSCEATMEVMQSPYPSAHSYGRTYGSHRAALELTNQQHFEVYIHAKRIGIDFIETLCAPSCLSMLELFAPDRLKVASRDLTNFPLLYALAETNLPIILSNGMHGIRTLEKSVDAIEHYHNNITMLHCTSEYPCRYENCFLHQIAAIKEGFPYPVGYSDHTIGIAVAVAAVAMGACMIEKHITLDRGAKGTDHAGSLGPDGMRRLIRDIRNIDAAMSYREFSPRAAESARAKLERSLASSRPIGAGSKISFDDVVMLSPGSGIGWLDAHKVVGKVASADIPPHTLLAEDMVCASTG